MANQADPRSTAEALLKTVAVEDVGAGGAEQLAELPRRLAVTWHVEWMEEFRQLPAAIVTFQIDPLGDVVISFVANCETQEEVDRLWQALATRIDP